MADDIDQDRLIQGRAWVATEHAGRWRSGLLEDGVTADPSPAKPTYTTVYNTIRPHQSLGYLTPAEYLASVGIDV